MNQLTNITQPWDIQVYAEGCLRIERRGQFVRQASFGSLHRYLARWLGPVPDHLADLLDVAAAVHVVDRLIPRGENDSGAGNDAWSRHLRIQLPVRDPGLWSQSIVKEALTDSLSFFTDDVWDLGFSYGARSRDTNVQGVLPIGGSTRVGLFSGGLDSLIGVAAEVEATDGTLLLLSVGLNSRLLHRQRQLLVKAANRLATRVVPIIVPLRLRQRVPTRRAEESSQRTRGFLFASVAAAAAWMTAAEEILYFENGVGAINLPLTPAQVGAQSTRSTHPVGLRKVGMFLNLLMQRDVPLRLPFLFATKGETCRLLATSGFRDLVGKTISCDSFPLRIEGVAQCGVCSSCLLRRQALWEADLEDLPEGGYRFDVLSHSNCIPEEELLPLKEMLWQVHRVRTAIGTDKGWRGLVAEFPALREIAEEVTQEGVAIEDAQQHLVSLYRRYCGEWERFPTHLASIALAA